MEFGIQGRVAMVAAASKGLGRACALSLAREGCAVSICGRSLENLDAARAAILSEVPGARVLTVPCDLSRAEALEAWVARTEAELGPVDILVTNTGGPAAATFMDLTEAQWEEGVQGTLMNVVRLSKRVLPGMRARGWGRIVHITSLVAKQPKAILTISSTLRAGISALTKVLATENAAFGVNVNAALPGHILTDRQLHLAEVTCAREGITQEAHFARQAKEIPAGRIGRPEEFGDVVAFLCSDRASYLTGVSLQVDGGIVGSTF